MQNVEWCAVYMDGTVLRQYNEGEAVKKYTDIDRSKLKEFRLYVDGVKKIVIHIDGNKRLIYRMRVAWGISGGTQGQQQVIYIAGWQEKREGKNTQRLCFLFGDGHVEILDKFDENHAWSSSIVFIKEEKLE
jgi:hypothetical protein